jgi:threonine dehydrogenase-like Zn-dependent dehydrogenase
VHPAVSGGFAEHLVVPAGNVIPLPAGMPEEHGALVEPLTVGLHAARRGRCQPDDRVLVIGGGPIGQACALAAGRLGVEAVVVTEPDPHRRSVVAGLGFNVLDPAAETLPDRVSDLLGGPATVVLDAVGASASFADAFEAAAVGARIVLVGMNTPRLDLSGYAISTREREIIGSFCYTAEEFRSTVEWAAAAPVELDRLVDGRVGLDEAPGCFTALGRGEMSASKIFVLPRG